MPRQSVIGSHKTSIRTENGETVVRYHDTDVIRFNKAKKRAVLNSGGWRTLTTKTRINQTAQQFGLGFTVYQEKHAWFIDRGDGKKIPFSDGMKIKCA